MIERPMYQEAIRKLTFQNGKMAFISGPRQVGKTTLALSFKKDYPKHIYYTWDDPVFKRRWAKDPAGLVEEDIGKHPLVILDELHKAPKWKSGLKGLYDLKKEFADFCITGSARLNIFRRGGDSLLGRYFLFRLHPFSLGELTQTAIGPDALASAITKPVQTHSKTYQLLFQFGGFPDPYIKQNRKFSNAWQISRVDRLLKEDLLDLAKTTEIRSLETMVALLNERAAQQLSLQSLAEDLDVSNPTVKRWLLWLSQLFYTYQVPPYTRNIARSLKKQSKLFLWDWSEIADEARRFENMIGGHLLKACHFWQDSGEGRFNLFYIRDKSKRECDFLIVRDGRPWLLTECKLNNTAPTESLHYYSEKLKPPLTLQLVHQTELHRAFPLQNKRKGILLSADSFLGLLP